MKPGAVQRPGDRLSAVDVSFLLADRSGGNEHAASGVTYLLDGPAPTRTELLAWVSDWVDQVPRLRHVVRWPALQIARPVWCEDPDFDLGYHVRELSLPADDGDETTLRRCLERLYAQAIDHNKPLWELYCIRGVDGGRFALAWKLHHTLADGVSLGQFVTESLCAMPWPRPGEGYVAPAFSPATLPSDWRLLALAIRDGARVLARWARLFAAARPRTTLRRAAAAADGIIEAARQLAIPAPEVPRLNDPIGPHRRFAWARLPLAELHEIRGVLGGTVNDAYMAIVAGAMHKWLGRRCEIDPGLTLKALVPVTTRTPDTYAAMGNRMSLVRVDLPVGAKSAFERYTHVTNSTAVAKSSRQAEGAELISKVDEATPVFLLPWTQKLHTSTHVFNLIVSNIRGPAEQLRMMGRALKDILLVNFLPPDHALVVTMISYRGLVEITLLADSRAVPDLQGLADALQDSLTELLALARGHAQIHDRAEVVTATPRRAAAGA